MAAYLTVERFKLLSSIPSSYIDTIEKATPGWTLAQIEAESAWLDSRLSKRYDAPFASPPPVIVERWITKIVTREAYKKRGYDPTDKQGQLYEQDRTEAMAEIKEAADSVDGLFELPKRADTTESGVERGFPQVYSETSPYAFTDVQGDVGHNEDANGGGGTIL